MNKGQEWIFLTMLTDDLGGCHHLIQVESYLSRRSDEWCPSLGMNAPAALQMLRDNGWKIGDMVAIDKAMIRFSFYK